jgi:hypothetical protein
MKIPSYRPVPELLREIADTPPSSTCITDHGAIGRVTLITTLSVVHQGIGPLFVYVPVAPFGPSVANLTA